MKGLPKPFAGLINKTPAYLTTGPCSDNVVSSDTLASPSVSLYVELKNCSSCSPGVAFSGRWIKELCASHDDGFLNGMYLLAHMKFISLYLLRSAYLSNGNTSVSGRCFARGSTIPHGEAVGETSNQCWSNCSCFRKSWLVSGLWNRVKKSLDHRMTTNLD